MGHSFGAWLFVSLLISGLGLGLFGYGKKMARVPQLVAGLLLLVYPYFVPTLVPTVVIAGVVLAAMGLALWLGW